MTINDLKDKVISGGLITIDDALFLSEADLDDLCKAAAEIQHTFFGNDFDICAVVNVKGGKCLIPVQKEVANLRLKPNELVNSYSNLNYINEL